MPNLKELRTRIASVGSTQKITSAMKMVAAAKLRRAQEQAMAARPYAERMERMLGALAASQTSPEGAPPLLVGNGRDAVQLIVVATSDRGLCGGFNSTIVRGARDLIRAWQAEGKTVKILCVGRKGHDQLKRQFGDLIVDTVDGIDRPRLTFSKADVIARRIATMFEDGEFDVCTIIYNHFRSAMTQVLTQQQLIPFPPPESKTEAVINETGATAIYEYEPSEEDILTDLLPRNLAVQMYRALLENSASEQGARMTAMDNATRNAGEMIDALTMNYNRTRQALITKELIEIISGAEAL